MKKRVLSLVLALVMCVGLAAPAFAAEPVDAPATVLDGETRTYNPAQADTGIVEGAYTRDAFKPTQFYNLDGQDYSVAGTFDTTIYTSYYFHPNADGKLSYNVTFEWQIKGSSGVPNMRVAKVQCWDKTDNKMATEVTYEMTLQANGLYGLTVETGNRQVYNLDPTHDYYFRYVKTPDGFLATVTGVIYT